MASVITKLVPPKTLTWRFGVAVLILTLISVLIGVRAYTETNQNTKCLADYITKNSQVSQARSGATQAKDEAVTRLLDRISKIVLNPSTDNERKFIQAFAQYQAAAKTLKTERAVNPLPDFPQECKDLNDAD